MAAVYISSAFFYVVLLLLLKVSDSCLFGYLFLTWILYFKCQLIQLQSYLVYSCTCISIVTIFNANKRL